MKQVLFIRPAPNAEGDIWWCESGSDEVSVLKGWEQLSSLADHPLAGRVCLLLPVQEMVFRHFSLPKQAARGQTQFSWLAEETLIGDVDVLHWTVLSKKGREVDAVAIDSQRLEQWLTLFGDAGLTVIQALPDAWLLPETAEGCTLVNAGESYWLRLPDGQAAECDAALLPLLVAKAEGRALCCYGDAPAAVEVTQPEAARHPLVLIQSQWQATKVNVLHGPFAQRTVSEKGQKRYRQLMIGLGVLACTLLFAPRAVTGWMLVQQENQLQEALVQIYQYHFPSMKQQTNIKYHFGQNMKKEKKGLFLQLETLADLKQNVPGVQVNSIEYDDREHKLTLLVESGDRAALQQFLEKANETFAFTLQPLSTEAPYTATLTGTSK